MAVSFADYNRPLFIELMNTSGITMPSTTALDDSEWFWLLPNDSELSQKILNCLNTSTCLWVTSWLRMLWLFLNELNAKNWGSYNQNWRKPTVLGFLQVLKIWTCTHWPPSLLTSNCIVCYIHLDMQYIYDNSFHLNFSVCLSCFVLNWASVLQISWYIKVLWPSRSN